MEMNAPFTQHKRKATNRSLMRGTVSFEIEGELTAPTHQAIPATVEVAGFRVVFIVVLPLTASVLRNSHIVYIMIKGASKGS